MIASLLCYLQLIEKRTRPANDRELSKSICYIEKNWRKRNQLRLLKGILYDAKHITDTRGMQYVVHSLSVSVV